MAIPEAQLEIWSHIGSEKQSSDTYQAIKKTLEASGTAYSGRQFEVFLQGSYGNDTNIYAESDVDIAITLTECFEPDVAKLEPGDKTAFDASHHLATYTGVEFKRDVLSALSAAYGKDALAGAKAISISPNGGRRKADVIVSVEHRRYYQFLDVTHQRFDKGIAFLIASGDTIKNFPRQHSDNCTTKHQQTHNRFKPMVRILKNLRGKLVSDGLLAPGTAPSYYLEGLLYNVPNELFTSGLQDTFVAVITWIQKADRSKFVCANTLYYLLRENSLVTWRDKDCDTFLAASVGLWNSWK